MSSSLRAVGARASHRSFRKFFIAGAALTGTGLLVVACSSITARPSATGGGAAQHAAARNDLALPAQARAPAPGQAPRSRSTSLVLSTQSIIYTAFLTVRVTTAQTVTGQATQAANMVSAVGGYVAGEQETIPQGTHASPQVNIELKIPAAQYSPTLAKLQSLDKLVSFSQQTRDVTQQVADVTSRVASAQAAITQLRALLKKAGSVSQLLSVQDQINNQESYLEALLAQQRALAHETSYATVTMLFIGHHAVVVKKPKKKIAAFSAGLRGGSHAFGLVVDWTLTALGSILPFLIPVALIGALVYASRRKLFRRKSPPAASPPAAEAP
jgi:hypothetical protein